MRPMAAKRLDLAHASEQGREPGPLELTKVESLLPPPDCFLCGAFLPYRKRLANNIIPYYLGFKTLLFLHHQRCCGHVRATFNHSLIRLTLTLLKESEEVLPSLSQQFVLLTFGKTLFKTYKDFLKESVLFWFFFPSFIKI